MTQGLPQALGSGISWQWRGAGALLVAPPNPKTPIYSPLWGLKARELEGTVGGLRGELRVVRHFEPVDEPDAAVARRARGDLHAPLPDALLLRRMRAGAFREETTVLSSELARAPLPAAGVE